MFRISKLMFSAAPKITEGYLVLLARVSGQVAPVAIIGRAGPFGRDHRGPQRRSGVQRTPNAGQSCGRLWPCSTSPAMHSAGSSAVMPATPNRPRRRSCGNPGRKRQAAGRNLADPAPLPRHLARKPSRISERRRIAFGAHAPRVLVLDLGSALLELLDAQVDALQDVERLEAGHHDRHAVLLRRSARIAEVPITVQTCPAARKPCTTQSGESSTARIAGGTSTWETSTEKFSRPSRCGLDHGHGVGRGGRLETDGEEDDLPVGMLAGQVRRRPSASRRSARRPLPT